MGEISFASLQEYNKKEDQVPKLSSNILLVVFSNLTSKELITIAFKLSKEKRNFFLHSNML